MKFRAFGPDVNKIYWSRIGIRCIWQEVGPVFDEIKSDSEQSDPTSNESDRTSIKSHEIDSGFHGNPWNRTGSDGIPCIRTRIRWDVMESDQDSIGFHEGCLGFIRIHCDL